MPPSPGEIAARALETAQKAEHVAEIAKMTAEAAKMVAESMVLEIRERFRISGEESKEFRAALMSEIQSQNRMMDQQSKNFDEFKTDFEKEVDKMDRRCIGHNEALFGNPDKGITGIVPQVKEHDGDIRKGKWTIWISGMLISWAVIYLTYFYGDALKRGVFNPSEAEWRWRIDREIKKVVKPEALKSQSDATPN